MARVPDLPCARCGKLLWRSGTSLPEGEAKCRECRRTAFEHGTAYAYSKRGCRCDDCRAAATVAAAEFRRRYRDRNGKGYEFHARKNLGYVCAECGDPVRGTGSAGKAADGLILCIEHRNAKRNHDRARMRRRANFRKAIAKAARGTKGNPRWPFFQGACWTCGEVFVRRGIPTPYCSKDCNPKSAHRGWIKSTVRRAIYERDGWVCQLCADPVDPNLDPAHDMAASLDHIEPQSLALIPNHSPENLRLAHRSCNSRRGNRAEVLAV